MSYLHEPSPWTDHNANAWSDTKSASVSPAPELFGEQFLAKSLDTPTPEIQAWGESDSHHTGGPHVSGSQFVDSVVTENFAAENFAAQGFATEDFAAQGFAAPADTHDEAFLKWSRTIRDQYDPLQPDCVVIEEIPEKEGILFKHTNYHVKLLTSDTSGRVVRRYSDFVWLLEVLLKKYPFRIIPDLPPKAIGSNNLDPVFLKRRCAGLWRFINNVMRHPVLRQEKLVLMFLTVPTDLYSWRKQAVYDTTEELHDKTIGAFVNVWSDKCAEKWIQCGESLAPVMDHWTKFTVLLERTAKRERHLARDREVFHSLLGSFGTCAASVYMVDPVDYEEVSSNLGIVSHGLKQEIGVSMQFSSEAERLAARFKTFTYFLQAVGALYERYENLAGNNVSQLKRRVELAEERLREMKSKADARGGDVDRAQEAIQSDKKLIAEQVNRNWLIRECIMQELVIFQETHRVVSQMFKEWANINYKYASMHAETFEGVKREFEY